MRMNIEIIEVEATEQNSDEIVGWYVADRLETLACSAEWTWNNRGNGPEITTDGVYGPFRTERAAEEYADKILSEIESIED